MNHNDMPIVKRAIRDAFGRVVRKIWVDYCIETGRTDRPDRIAPWEELDEWSREADRRIGEGMIAYWLSGQEGEEAGE